MRTLLALLIAPLVPFAFVTVFAGIYDALVYLAIFGYPAILLCGVPVHVLLLKLHRTSWLAYIAAGFTAALLAELVYFMLVSAAANPARDFAAFITTLQDGFDFVAVGFVGVPIGLCGALAALTFWLIVRPDHASAAR